MNFFKRDVVLLLLVSVLLGTAMAKLLSYGANLYFQQTLTSLVGDYGEYDLLLQIREDYREEGRAQLERILADSFAGASVKEGPAIIGKANLFVTLPEERKNQAVYENLDRLFAGVPGISGVSVLTEPRLNIRGIPAGAAAMLEEELKAIEGVRFVYRSGGSIGVVLAGTKQIQAVTRRTERALTRNKIVDISFPVGIEPDNPVLLAEAISKSLYRELQLQTAQYVSVDTGGDDMVHMVATMQELRRFLLTYAAKVEATPEGDARLAPGDRLVFQGAESEPPAPGGEARPGHAVVLLTETGRGGKFSGVIVQGTEDGLKGSGYAEREGRISAAAARATVENPRALLVRALSESADLLEKLPGLLKESDALSEKARGVLDGYAEGAQRMQKTAAHMDEAVAVMQGAAQRLESANIGGLKSQLDQSARSMSSLLGALRLVRVFNPDIAGAMAGLESTQEKLQGFSALLEGMGEIAAEAAQAKDIVGNLAEEGKSVARALQNFSGSQAEAQLLAAHRQLQTLAKTDFAGMARAMRHLADQAPRLTDEDIYRSVQLMDKVIEGRIIPGKRLQIMVDRDLRLDQAKPLIYAALGHENAGVYETDLGMIEPNLYLQFYQVLKEVQAVLAGLTALALTAVFLALDHTAVMSALRGERLRRRGPAARQGFGAQLRAAFGGVFHAENCYGMAVGAALLTLMFFLSGGGIPYTPWYAIPAVGALLGLAAAGLTEKITPVAWDEVLAGQSLGMSFEEIMREIVIPSARPGLLQRLNRRRLYFRRREPEEAR